MTEELTPLADGEVDPDATIVPDVEDRPAAADDVRVPAPGAPTPTREGSEEA